MNRKQPYMFRPLFIAIFSINIYRKTYIFSKQLGQTANSKIQCVHNTIVQPWQYIYIHRVILSVIDTRKCEYLKDCSLDFEHAYMTTYLAS